MWRVFISIGIILLLTNDFARLSYADEKLVINEAMVHPSNGQKEWVELFGPANLDLKSYWIDDDTNFSQDVGNSYKVSMQSVTVGSDSNHYVVQIPIGIFNNPGDSVVLFDSLGQVVDQFTYTSDPGVDVTLGRFPDGTGEFKPLVSSTMGMLNTGPKPTNTPIPTPTPKPTKIPTPTRTPTQTPTATKAKTTTSVVPTTKPSVTPTVSPTPSNLSDKSITQIEASLSAMPSAVLGIQTTRVPSPPVRKPTITTLVKGTQRFPSLVPIIGGIVILGSAIILYLKRWKNY